MSKINRSQPFVAGDVFLIDHTISKRCELSVFGTGVTIELSPETSGTDWFAYTPASTGAVTTFTTQARRIKLSAAPGFISGPIVGKE